MTVLADPPVTLFTTCKPVAGIDAVFQRNAISSWRANGFSVIVFGDDPGVAELCQELDCQHVREVATNEQNLPYISSLFSGAFAATESPYIAYLNSDIILDSNFRDQLETFLTNEITQSPQLISSRRRTLPLMIPLDMDSDWESVLHDADKSYGIWDRPTAIDVFIVNRDWLVDMPDLFIGRPTWDNWMIHNALTSGAQIIDLSLVAPIFHPLHGYAFNPHINDNDEVSHNRAIVKDNLKTLEHATHYYDGQQLKAFDNDSRTDFSTKFATEFNKRFFCDLLQMRTMIDDGLVFDQLEYLRTILARRQSFVISCELMDRDHQQSDLQEVLDESISHFENKAYSTAIELCEDFINRYYIEQLIAEDADVYIWGTGVAGTMAAELLTRYRTITGFIDNDLTRQGQAIQIGEMPYPIYAPAHLSQNSKKCYVVIGSMFHKDIAVQLCEMGLRYRDDFM